MLLKVLKEGRQVYRHVCDVCGQEELHDCEGGVLCSNCGEAMHPMDEEQGKAVEVAYSFEPSTEEMDVGKFVTPKRRGRPPRSNTPPRACCNCSNAMTAIKGYTCKVSLEPKLSSDLAHDGCGYVEGKPVK